ncbi:hypothetical protein Tco_1571110 [Tanacetum coccineum]
MVNQPLQIQCTSKRLNMRNQSDLANRLVPDREETLTLEKESRSKLNKDLVRPYDYTKLNSLYEIFKPASQEYNEQLDHANEVRKKMWRKSFVIFKPSIFKNIGFLHVSKSISKSRQAYNVMTNNINHFRELVDQAWEKHSHNNFRAPTALDMEVLIKTCLMPLAIKTQNDSFAFARELKQEMYADLNYVESIEKEIDELEFDKAEFSNMYDILMQECVSNDVMCAYLHSLCDLDAHAQLQCLYVHKVKECEFTPHSWPDVRKSSFAKPYDVNAPRPSRNSPKHVSFQSPKESIGSNAMVYNYYLEEAKKKAQLQKDKALNTKPSLLIPAESNSLPHAHTHATKTYYKHQDSRIKKAQELNRKTSANFDIQDLPKYQDYQDNDCQGRLLGSFQDDA